MKMSESGLAGRVGFQPVEVQWEDITITAKIKKTKFVGCKLKTEIENKVILNNLKGIARPHTFTVIFF